MYKAIIIFFSSFFQLYTRMYNHYLQLIYSIVYIKVTSQDISVDAN